MQSWDLTELEVEPRQPEVLVSAGEGRAIAIQLPAGEALDEHQVHERAWVVVVSGQVELVDVDGATVSGGPGLFAEFDPNERRVVRATEDARVLLILTPWPGVGHPSLR
jgi:redox-sensitive bicupin YhaK (pirin superfamily)